MASKEPPKTNNFILSYPFPEILLITINRPKQMNSIPSAAHWEAAAIMNWFDASPTLRVAIITGSGPKAFSAGQDLIEQAHFKTNPPPMSARRHPPEGFCGISRRVGKKPVIAAVNGFALGGGFEICLNCDMVVASPTATFGLPEAGVGLYAAAGGLPRLVHIVGMPLATEISLTGRRLSASEALSLNLINKISSSPSSLIDETIELARKIGKLSPDAVIVTRAALRETWEDGSVERGSQRVSDRYLVGLAEGENMRIGLEAFRDKKVPKWVPSKL
ncbi:enoyl-CoA hydratase-like protein [Tricladium varicosporioides]|nr:enoyl-CoA hydratase-like protein [Hymenoscyphus varicosporioides]